MAVVETEEEIVVNVEVITTGNEVQLRLVALRQKRAAVITTTMEAVASGPEDKHHLLSHKVEVGAAVVVAVEVVHPSLMDLLLHSSSQRTDGDQRRTHPLSLWPKRRSNLF